MKPHITQPLCLLEIDPLSISPLSISPLYFLSLYFPYLYLFAKFTEDIKFTISRFVYIYIVTFLVANSQQWILLARNLFVLT